MRGNQMISAWDCFHFATLELVRSTPIKQRLVCAYRRHLAALRPEQVPEEVRGSYSQVTRALSGVPPLRGEDAVAASVRKMSMQDADDCAALIVEIFGLMARRHAEHARPHTVVQLQAVERAGADYITEEYEVAALAGRN
jgi:hypothetical protein